MIPLKQTGASISFPSRVIIYIIINLVITFNTQTSFHNSFKLWYRTSSDVFWDPIVKAYTLSHKRITDSMQPSYRPRLWCLFLVLILWESPILVKLLMFFLTYITFSKIYWDATVNILISLNFYLKESLGPKL